MLSHKQLQEKASERFLGRYGVVGVGESGAAQNALMFLFQEWSPMVWRRIQKWAKDEGVRVDYQVVGDIKLR